VAELTVFLASDNSGKLSGRLIFSERDDWPSLPDRVPEIMASDTYLLRRVDLS
jgi:hypothetical protein